MILRYWQERAGLSYCCNGFNLSGWFLIDPWVWVVDSETGPKAEKLDRNFRWCYKSAGKICPTQSPKPIRKPSPWQCPLMMHVSPSWIVHACSLHCHLKVSTWLPSRIFVRDHPNLMVWSLSMTILALSRTTPLMTRWLCLHKRYMCITIETDSESNRKSLYLCRNSLQLACCSQWPRDESIAVGKSSTYAYVKQLHAARWKSMNFNLKLLLEMMMLYSDWFQTDWVLVACIGFIM